MLALTCHPMSLMPLHEAHEDISERFLKSTGICSHSPADLYSGVMANDLTTQTPVEIDRFLSENYQEQVKLQFRIASDARHLERVKNSKWGTPREIEATAATLESNRQALRALIAATAPYQLEFSRRGGWHRYFLVTNANGHVHREMNCTTCFRTTQYSWLVDLADCVEDDMIEEWGERACTVCFPTAPVNPNYNRPARIDREAREARATEAAARQAAKDAKGIVDIDGSPLKDAHGYTLKTKVAARNELSGAIENVCYGYGPEYEALVRRLVPALEAAGVDWLKAATNKVNKVRKEAAKPNPYAQHLTAEQVADSAAKVQAGLARAEALLKEVVA